MLIDKDKKNKRKQWLCAIIVVPHAKSHCTKKGNRTESTTLAKLNESYYHIPITSYKPHNCSWADNAVWWNYFLVCLLVVCLVRRLKKQQHLNKKFVTVNLHVFIKIKIKFLAPARCIYIFYLNLHEWRKPFFPISIKIQFFVFLLLFPNTKKFI